MPDTFSFWVLGGQGQEAFSMPGAERERARGRERSREGGRGRGGLKVKWLGEGDVTYPEGVDKARSISHRACLLSENEIEKEKD